jgi:hypothetical protein
MKFITDLVLTVLLFFVIITVFAVLGLPLLFYVVGVTHIRVMLLAMAFIAAMGLVWVKNNYVIYKGEKNV